MQIIGQGLSLKLFLIGELFDPGCSGQVQLHVRNILKDIGRNLLGSLVRSPGFRRNAIIG